MGVDARLEGKRVLVVEDEASIAALLEIILTDAGCSVVGPVASVQAAIAEVGQAAFDAAVLDVRVNNCEIYAVADALSARGVPFVFVSGFSRKDMPARYRDCAHVAKPFSPDAVLAQLDKVAGRPH